VRWVRLDTAFPRNHKVLALLAQKDGHRALVVYVCGLSYSGEQGTDGFIPREALGLLHGRQADAARLAAVRLWMPETGGWVINGWHDFQPSTKEMHERSIRARAAAQSRWNREE
jgi:hypothetical protein